MARTLMHLAQLLENVSGMKSSGQPEVSISGMTADSRQVSPGFLFVATRGTATDGHIYLDEAVRGGAAAAVGELPDPGLPIPYIQVTDSQLALAEIAASYHGYPARKLVMIGVTGTDGKSTTCNLLHAILTKAGLRAGLITTVNAVIGDRVLDTGLHVTTPEAVQVQGYLRDMVEAGLTHCILEATSHGLAQHRVSACEFDIGVVTNITHEHLDYHGGYSEYREAKSRLFRQLAPDQCKPTGPEKSAVLNQDDDSFPFLEGITRARVYSYGLAAGANVRGEGLETSIRGLTFEILDGGQRYPVRSAMLGEYNAYNMLAAWTAAVKGLGIPPQVAARGLAELEGVPGRMELIELGQPFTAVVDFAHTPNALTRALETARALTKGKVIAVFGSAGLRDREKRRLMAEVSARLADATVLTAEDPRTEPLGDILSEMAAGAEAGGGREGETFWRIADRGQALRFALQMAGKDDLVISCGKGHEQSMCFGTTEYPWDDRVAMRAALSALLQVPGPEMPSLPTST
jgi:UDP-N-acetylmuramoyl-L-alanyl-D-glutamate--2,6-diaminopimelate ligase